jgi:hypothetical protein
MRPASALLLEVGFEVGFHGLISAYPVYAIETFFRVNSNVP